MSAVAEVRIADALVGIERVRRLIVGLVHLGRHTGDPEDSGSIQEIAETAKARLDEVAMVLEGSE